MILVIDNEKMEPVNRLCTGRREVKKEHENKDGGRRGRVHECLPFPQNEVPSEACLQARKRWKLHSSCLFEKPESNL